MVLGERKRVIVGVVARELESRGSNNDWWRWWSFARILGARLPQRAPLHRFLARRPPSYCGSCCEVMPLWYSNR